MSITTQGIPNRKIRRSLYKGIPVNHDLILIQLVEIGSPAEYTLNKLRNMYIMTEPGKRNALMDGLKSLVAKIQSGEIERDEK